MRKGREREGEKSCIPGQGERDERTPSFCFVREQLAPICVQGGRIDICRERKKKGQIHGTG